MKTQNSIPLSAKRLAHLVKIWWKCTLLFFAKLLLVHPVYIQKRNWHLFFNAYLHDLIFLLQFQRYQALPKLQHLTSIAMPVQPLPRETVLLIGPKARFLTPVAFLLNMFNCNLRARTVFTLCVFLSIKYPTASHITEFLSVLPRPLHDQRVI